MSRRPHLRVVSRTPEEEAAILLPSPAEEAKASAAFVGWKFRLLDTINADPMADAYCLSVAMAYLHFLNRKTRCAYLSEVALTIRTGGPQPRTVRKAKQRLTDLGYLPPVGRTAAGIVIYRFDNPRAELVADHLVIAAEVMAEQEAQKKEKERARRKGGAD